MSKTIAELMVESLKNARVKRVYGLPGDSLNGFTDALRRDGTVEWVHVPNGEPGDLESALRTAFATPVQCW